MRISLPLILALAVPVFGQTTQPAATDPRTFAPFMEKFVSAFKTHLEDKGSAGVTLKLSSTDVVQSDSTLHPLVGTATLVASFTMAQAQVQADVRMRFDLKFAPGTDLWEFLSGEATYERYVVNVPALNAGDDRTGERQALPISWADGIYNVMFPPPDPVLPPVTLPFESTEQFGLLNAAVENSRKSLATKEDAAKSAFEATEEAKDMEAQVDAQDAVRTASTGQARLDASSQWIKLKQKLSQMEQAAVDGDAATRRAREECSRSAVALEHARAEYANHPATQPAGQ